MKGHWQDRHDGLVEWITSKVCYISPNSLSACAAAVLLGLSVVTL